MVFCVVWWDWGVILLWLLLVILVCWVGDGLSCLIVLVFFCKW